MGHGLVILPFILSIVRWCSMTNNTHENDETEVQKSTKEDDVEEHLPEWVKLFRELREEANRAYPDGRVRIIVPRRKQRQKKKKWCF